MTLLDKLKNWLNIATLSIALLGVIFVGVGMVADNRRKKTKLYV
jgi:hypothetical protein